MFFVNGQKVGEAIDPYGLDDFNSVSLNLDPGPSGGDVILDNLVARGH